MVLSVLVLKVWVWWYGLKEKFSSAFYNRFQIISFLQLYCSFLKLFVSKNATYWPYWIPFEFSLDFTKNLGVSSVKNKYFLHLQNYTRISERILLCIHEVVPLRSDTNVWLPQINAGSLTMATINGRKSTELLWWVDIDWLSGAHQATLPLPLLKRAAGRKIRRKACELRTGSSLSNCHHGQNRPDLGKWI